MRGSPKCVGDGLVVEGVHRAVDRSCGGRGDGVSQPFVHVDLPRCSLAGLQKIKRAGNLVDHGSVHVIDQRSGLESRPDRGVRLHRQAVVTMLSIDIVPKESLGLGANSADCRGKFGLDRGKSEYLVLLLHHLDKLWRGHYIHRLPRQRHGENGLAGFLTESGNEQIVSGL